MVMRSRACERIAVQLFPSASARMERELGAFARYCIHRLERGVGQRDGWLVQVTPSSGGFASRIVLTDRGAAIEADGAGHDGPLAIWEAVCRLEQRLRELCR